MKDTKNKDEVNIQKLYGKEGTLPKEEFIKEYNIDLNGLTSKEAQAKLIQNGDKRKVIFDEP